MTAHPQARRLPEAATPGRGLDFGPLAARLGYVLRRAQLAVFRDFIDAFAAFDVKPAQYSILTIIEHNPGLKQTQICDALGIKRTNLVAMIDELESRGLARREEVPGDRRSHALVLTPAGAELMPKLHDLSDAHEHRLILSLGGARHKEMLRVMATLACDLDAAE